MKIGSRVGGRRGCGSWLECGRLRAGGRGLFGKPGWRAGRRKRVWSGPGAPHRVSQLCCSMAWTRALPTPGTEPEFASVDLPVAIGDGADESARSFSAAGGKFLPPGEASMPGQIVATDFGTKDSTDLPAILTDGRGRPRTPAWSGTAGRTGEPLQRSLGYGGSKRRLPAAPLVLIVGVVAMPDLVDGEEYGPPGEASRSCRRPDGFPGRSWGNCAASGRDDARRFGL